MTLRDEFDLGITKMYLRSNDKRSRSMYSKVTERVKYTDLYSCDLNLDPMTLTDKLK